MTKFELALAQLRAEHQDFNKMVYVTKYDNVEEYASLREISYEEAYKEIVDLSGLVYPPTKEELSEPFIVIDETGSTRFDITLSSEINSNKNAVLYYEHGEDEIEVIGEVMTTRSLTVEEAIELLDFDAEDYDYNAIKLAY